MLLHSSRRLSRGRSKLLHFGVQEMNPELLAAKEKDNMTNANVDHLFLVAASHALKKGMDAASARNDLDAGVHTNIKLDLHIEIDELRIAPDTDKAPTASIPLLPTLALLVQRFVPKDRDKAIQVLKEVMEKAVELTQDDQKDLLDELGVKDAEKMIKEQIISSMARVPVKGAVKPEGVSVTITGMSSGD